MYTSSIGFAGLSLPLQRKPVQQAFRNASTVNRPHFGGDSFTGIWSQENPDFKVWMNRFNALPEAANWTETTQKRLKIINRLINEYLIPNVKKAEPISVVHGMTDIQYKFRLDGHEVSLSYPRPIGKVVANEQQPRLTVDNAGYSFGEVAPLEQSVVKLRKALEESDETFFGPLGAKFGFDANLEFIPFFQQLAASTRNGEQEWERGSNMQPFQRDKAWTTLLPNETRVTIGEVYHGFERWTSGGRWQGDRITTPAISNFIGFQSPDNETQLVMAISSDERPAYKNLEQAIRQSS